MRMGSLPIFMSSLVYFFKVLSFDVEDFHFLDKM